MTFLLAWLSLGAQVLVLVGAHGLLPVASWLGALRSHGVSWADAPTWLWLGASDRALSIGICFGALLAVLAACELRPQLCFALSTVLYLGYAVGCRDFLAFQWDNLLLECGALAVFLPARRSSRWIHVLFRMLLFKLYFESGLAKLESPLGDWLDGSAMRFYYQTAPLPTALAYFCHALPPFWHRVESNLTLVWELCVPLLIWAPRRARRVAFTVFSCFQLINIATANYGFFSYLALFMGVFLLDEGDVWRMRDFVAARLPRRALRRLSLAAHEVRRARAFVNRAPRLPMRWLRGLRCAVATIVTASWAGISIDGALHLFAGQKFAPLDIIADVAAPFRLVSDYHLFMQVTRERIEPTF
ncbi:MAG TPA: lipase maturation factor family protein, partial [Polyangiaceae bacterium]